MVALSTAATARPGHPPGLELRGVLELLEARVDFGTSQGTEPFHSKLLAAEAAHHRAVDHGAVEVAVVGRRIAQVDIATSEVAHETAGKAVACTGRIEDLVEQVAGRGEPADLAIAVFEEQQRAVLTTLNNDRLGPHAHDLRRGLLQV